MQISSASYAPIPQNTPTRASTRESAPAATPDAAPQTLHTLPPLRLLQGAELQGATADFAADLGKLFRSAGISVPPDPVLSMDFAGKVVVANDHPDKDRIEQLFVDKPEMRDRFAELSAAHSLQRAVEGYDDFVAAYERLQGNPEAQAALVRDRIAHNKAQFFMNIGADGAEPFFGGLGRVTA
ncbi:hypothetical protein IAI53_13815 [Thauera sp. CAU 1555]|uniref:Uncharacterized protein n=1 Tax=Thauera sedimentorum TaxID=2767595 RepID=A0ABR9BCP4_9RHOO|nr:hypothetical protein [Thauera sedimentorum]MBC9073048.1 hypothetical protein [Thauera sedimentorum]MBD8503967.1 hypothetical protein [Thauera sedimentorum]